MPELLATNFETGVNLMQNLKDESQKSRQPEQNGAERRNLPQFDNKSLVVKDYNIIVFFIYNLFFAPLAVPVFLYIGDIFPYYTPFISVAFAVVSYLSTAPIRALFI
jgi:hypothetical protein